MVSSSLWHKQAFTLSVKRAQKHRKKNFVARLLFLVVISAIIQNKLFTRKKKKRLQSPSFFTYLLPAPSPSAHSQTFNQHSYTCQQTLAEGTLSISDLFLKQNKVLTRVKKDVCFPSFAKFCFPLLLYKMPFRKGIVLWI